MDGQGSYGREEGRWGFEDGHRYFPDGSEKYVEDSSQDYKIKSKGNRMSLDGVRLIDGLGTPERGGEGRSGGEVGVVVEDWRRKEEELISRNSGFKKSVGNDFVSGIESVV